MDCLFGLSLQTSSLDLFGAGELSLSLEDYQLLQAMNSATAERYSAIADDAAGLADLFARLQVKADALRPHLEQVGRIEEQLGELEAAAGSLDRLTQRLETQYRSLAASRY